MTNAEWCIKNKIKFEDIHIDFRGANSRLNTFVYDVKCLPNNNIIGNISAKIGYGVNLLSKWLDKEHKEPPILDDGEKRYLKAVIKPWRGEAKKINYIKKQEGTCTGRIIINTYYGNMEFPAFDAGTMYKGMERGREYSPEELGL